MTINFLHEFNPSTSNDQGKGSLITKQFTILRNLYGCLYLAVPYSVPCTSRIGRNSWRHSSSALISSVTTTLSHVTDWRTVLPSALMRRGGFHHGVDAGKRTISSDRIFPISPNTSLIFLAGFVGQVSFVRAYVRSGDDSIANKDEFNLLWLTVALCLCLASLPVNSPKSKLASKPFPCGNACWRAGVFYFSLVTFYNGNWHCNFFKYYGQFVAGLVDVH